MLQYFATFFQNNAIGITPGSHRSLINIIFYIHIRSGELSLSNTSHETNYVFLSYYKLRITVVQLI